MWFLFTKNIIVTKAKEHLILKKLKNSKMLSNPPLSYDSMIVYLINNYVKLNNYFIRNSTLHHTCLVPKIFRIIKTIAHTGLSTQKQFHTPLMVCKIITINHIQWRHTKPEMFLSQTLKQSAQFIKKIVY